MYKEEDRDGSNHRKMQFGPSIRKSMKKSYIDYAMSVIISRATSGCKGRSESRYREGRLYDMHELGIRYDRPYRKCARIVGDTMGKYHPHGDSSIYDALVVMAQDFKKGHGRW